MHATLEGIPFAPTRDALESAIALIGTDPETGSAHDAAARRAAFARFESGPIPGMKGGRGWRHDYAHLAFEDLSWSSRRLEVAAMPRRAAVPAPSTKADGDAVVADQPAMETRSAAALIHHGSTFVDLAGRAQRDARIVVLPLADARRTHAAYVNGVLGRVAQPDRFTALASAFQNCGAFVYVPDGVVVDEPIQLAFTYDDPENAAVFPQIVVVLGDGARATVIERHDGESDPFVCATVEVAAGEHARLDYVVVQRASEAARIFANRAGLAESGAVVSFHVAELGGTLVRSVVHEDLGSEGAAGEIGGLFFNTGFQHVDLTTTTDHTVGRTRSSTVVRSAATDRGQGRFTGNIAIRAGAHGADASLRDDALLLSQRSHIDSVPALEIAANDVRAFHGATVGSLDEEALFYASSRGIPRTEAARMVALAFFEPAISRFPGDALREEIRTALDQKIDAATEIGV